MPFSFRQFEPFLTFALLNFNIDSMSLIHHLNEGLTRILYTRVLEEGHCAIDVGANRGDHSRVMSSIVGADGLIHAVEPNRAHWNSLLSIKGNVSVWPFAAGDSTSVETLHIPGDDGWASLDDRPGIVTLCRQSAIQVRLDDIHELHLRKISFVKIDVEGREIHALRGMRSLLTKCRPIVVFEIWTEAIQDFFAELDYEILDLLGQKLSHRSDGFPNCLARPSESDAMMINKTTIPKAVFEIEQSLAQKLSST